MKRTNECGFENGTRQIEKLYFGLAGISSIFKFFVDDRIGSSKPPRENSASADQLWIEQYDYFDTTLSQDVKTRRKTSLEEDAKEFGPEHSTLKHKSLGDLTSKKNN